MTHNIPNNRQHVHPHAHCTVYQAIHHIEQLISTTIQDRLAAIANGQFDTVDNLNTLWQAIEPTLGQLPNAEQLRLAGYAIEELSELCKAKAEKWLTDWEERYSATGPTIDENLLHGLVQQTMYLNLEGLVKSKPKPPRRRPPSGSIVGTVDKQTLLNALDAIEEQEATKQSALAVAHDEDVSAWIGAITQWLNQGDRSPHSKEVWFSELCTALKHTYPTITPVKVFLALLLGGYHLEQSGDFYQSDILVTCNDS